MDVLGRKYIILESIWRLQGANHLQRWWSKSKEVAARAAKEAVDANFDARSSAPKSPSLTSMIYVYQLFVTCTFASCLSSSAVVIMIFLRPSGNLGHDLVHGGCFCDSALCTISRCMHCRLHECIRKNSFLTFATVHIFSRHSNLSHQIISSTRSHITLVLNINDCISFLKN